ncbi:hypothetical protein D9M71_446640 [compost metagenome]
MHAEMMDVDDRRAVVTGCLQQQTDLRHRRLHAGKRQDATAILLLRVDDQQGALAEGGWRITAPGDLQQAQRLGHVTTPDDAMPPLWAVTRAL